MRGTNSVDGTGGGAGARRLLVVAVTLAATVALPAPAGAAEEACPPRTGPAAHLPDCRAYELVSPAEKAGEDAFAEGALAQAGGEGGEIAYGSKNVFAQSPGAGIEAGYLSRRGSGGWATEPLTPVVRQPVSGDILSYAFSPDLSQTVIRVPLETLTPQAPEGVYNLYLRGATGGYSLITAAPPSVPVPAGCKSCYGQHDKPVFMGGSSDFTHLVFETDESLLTQPQVPAGTAENLYESNLGEPPGERVHPVGVLPDGTLAAGAQAGAGGGNINAEGSLDVAHAISADGSHIVFTADADGGAPDSEQSGLPEVYDRIGGPSGRTVELSAPVAGALAGQCETADANCKAERAQYWDASEGGDAVLFTSKAALTRRSNTGTEVSGEENVGEDLYRYDLSSESLLDLTPDAGEADGAQVQGVVGASANGSVVYFVARGVLAGTNAQGAAPAAGADNLYRLEALDEDGTTVVRPTVFIATLREPEPSEPEPLSLGDARDWSAEPEQAQAYVTPDGGHLAFVSLQALTGFDNDDRSTERPDTEVFEYSAADQRLECASCGSDPQARPAGNSFIDRETAAGSEAVGLLRAPRAMSADGSRLFFSSPNDLTSEPITPHEKVFEFEGGADHLISGGSSETNDIFMDSSESGDDVFFATSQQLVPEDQDGALDVYDARVGGGFAAPVSAAAPCAGEACLPPPAEAPSFPAPATATLEGNGNLAPISAPAPKKPLTRAQKLARALRACRHEAKRKRAACVRLAHRRYGAKRKKPAKRRRSTRGRA